MIEKIHELKQKAMDRADYYSRINFPNLANEFTELVNILNEMEAIVTERDELKARVQIMTEEARSAREEDEED
jgi:uncharacterized coiled-coil DUF342 family protein